ncbi:hypothetical protein HYS97_02150 [Candidatus Daviesbacteria bacterium]|nr:hypothetical protein [Candidatus Daviesbacteria bacterium]
MKLFLIHGNGLVGQSNKISQIKKNFDSLAIVEISGKETDFKQAVLDLSTPQLFSDNRLMVLDGFDEDVDLASLPPDESLTVVLRFTKQLNSSSLIIKSAQKLKAEILLFSEEEETSIFPFLDALAEKAPQALNQLDKLIDGYGSQYVLTMMFYLLRRQVIGSKKLPPFIMQKIERQKRNFPKEKIEKLYKFGLETDFKIKSGLMEERLGLTLFADKFLTN